jgi:hypothetical protein
VVRFAPGLALGPLGSQLGIAFAHGPLGHVRRCRWDRASSITGRGLPVKHGEKLRRSLCLTGGEFKINGVRDWKTMWVLPYPIGTAIPSLVIH